jgi:FkbM family methyltransferase
MLLEIRLGSFRSDEPEFALLEDFVHPGDWVLDIGANRGEYTLRLSRLVGPEGRVFAFEPFAPTVAFLADAVRHAPYDNVTVLNVAASARAGLGRLEVPTARSGLPNHRQARLSEGGIHATYCLAADQLDLPHRVAFIKIDTETHEASVLDGLMRTIVRDKPVLLVEGHEGLHQRLAPLGYRLRPRAPGSPNILFEPS